MNRLIFGKGNAKVGPDVYTFSLPSGHSCPFALSCLAKVDRVSGKLTDGPSQVFRCFSASQEAVYPSVRKARWHNFELLRRKSYRRMRNLIHESLPPNAKIIRIHVSGDFFNQSYFDAWQAVARINPGIVFYAYTKSLPYWVKRIDRIPENFRLTASFGGRANGLIPEFNLKSATVVMDQREADILGLEVDHDDTHAQSGDESFALLIHGKQKAGTPQSFHAFHNRKAKV